MAIPTSNYGTKYFNTNQCYSFNDTFGTALKALSAQPCSEVIIWNQTGQILYIYDGLGADGSHRLESHERLAIPAAAATAPLQPYTIRGVTDANQLSAKTASSSGLVYWRTQFFSSNPKTS